jgi:hypothetical protein
MKGRISKRHKDMAKWAKWAKGNNKKDVGEREEEKGLILPCAQEHTNSLARSSRV